MHRTPPPHHGQFATAHRQHDLGNAFETFGLGARPTTLFSLHDKNVDCMLSLEEAKALIIDAVQVPWALPCARGASPALRDATIDMPP